jgi:hypothetical protein
MTAEPVGPPGWAPDAFRRHPAGHPVEDTGAVRTAPSGIRPPIAGIAP